MSLDVESNSPTTTTWSWTASSPELRTTTTSSTPMSSSSTTASPPLPSLSTPILSTPLFAPPSASSPPSTSTSSTMTTSTTTVPSTTISSTVTPTTTVPTTTVSITVTPTITITTTASISTSPELFPTISPTTTTITTVIPPPTSVSSTTSAGTPTTSVSSTTPTSAGTPTTSSITSRSSSTYSGRSMTPTTSSPSITPLVSTLLRGSSPTPTPEAMLSSPTRIGPVSTFSSTVFISTTDSRGLTTVYTPSLFTTTMTFMTGDTTTTSTGTFANPTLNTDTSPPSSFFQNKGAVAGVFTLVGIALISIIIWSILFIRRKRQEKGHEHDSDILAALVEHRPMDPDTSTSSLNSRYDPFLAIPMANSNTEGDGRSTSGLLGNNSRRRTIMPDAYHDDRRQYDPYIEYGPRSSRDSYRDMPSPTTPYLNIPPSAFAPYRSSNDGMGMVEAGTGLPLGTGIVHARHSHHSSGSSFEPLLTSHQRRNSLMPGRGPIVLDASNLSNGRASRTPSTDNTSSASTSKPSYLPSLTHPNFYATNTSSHSAILINGQEGHGSEVNLVDANGEIKKQRDVLEVSEVSTAEDEHELELQKPVLAVRNLPDAASTLSLS